jgi:tyrosyl-tRNA synthetase
MLLCKTGMFRAVAWNVLKNYGLRYRNQTRLKEGNGARTARFSRAVRAAPTSEYGLCEDLRTVSVFKTLRDRGLLDACTSETIIEQTETPLRVYCGFDPTSDSLHVGNLMGIVVLSWFQKHGHVPVALIGGATGRVGDPSGKSSERPVLDEATINTNSQSIEALIRNILSHDMQDGHELLVVNNLEWYSTMGILDFLREIGKFSRLGTMLAKDSVKSRLASQSGISFTEFSYQLLQGYDFVHLFRQHRVSVQIGGSDQWGNITAGTDLLRRLEPSAVVCGLTFPLLLKSDGKKFGKSEQGAIWLSAKKLSPYKFYQYFLNVEDADVIRLLKSLTFIPLSEISELDRSMKTHGYVVNSAQKRLAEELTIFVHGAQGLREAHVATNVLRPGAITKLNASALSSLSGLVPGAELPVSEVVGKSLVNLVVQIGFQPSKGATKRLIEGGGLRINNLKVDSDELIVSEEDLLDGKLLLLSSGKKNKLLLTVIR